MLKNATIYQMKDDGTSYGKAFMSYKYITSTYGKVDINWYDKVANIEIPEDIAEQDLINILEYVFTYGNTNQKFYLDNPKARSISVSDLIEINGIYNYVDSLGFVELEENDYIKSNNDLVEDKELLAEEGEDEPPYIEGDKEDTSEIDNNDEVENETLIDYLQDRIGQQLTVAEFNTILQSLFSRYNDIFIMESDLYNADLDENQELTIWEDNDEYIINYDIIDVEAGIIEITDVNIE